ncbi:hypothetical protein [Aureivirga sp. CE67]|uniref:hypothetical protein n=1 Tax=Aureivirga sp. CE67 TaxID=1788983 RepID=UPI0018CB0615|nr:hypothetical protein [Aureivirga sp. CE67]
MKKQYQIILFIFLAIILHNFNFSPISYENYNSTRIHSTIYDEVLFGALAGDENLTYKFILKDGSVILRGHGERIIELREKNEPNYNEHIGKYFPFYKWSKFKATFACYEAKNNRYLGTISNRNEFSSKGLISLNKFENYIENGCLNYICQILEEKRIFFNQLDSSDDDVRSKLSIDLNLEETGDSIALHRNISIKDFSKVSIDSLLFSSYKGTPEEYHHELIKTDYTKNRYILQRYSNNGKLILEAVFALDKRILGDSVQESFITNITATLLEYTWFEKGEKTIIEINPFYKDDYN